MRLTGAFIKKRQRIVSGRHVRYAVSSVRVHFDEVCSFRTRMIAAMEGCMLQETLTTPGFLNTTLRLVPGG